MFFLCHQAFQAQDLFAVAKGGISSYGSLYIGPLGGGGGDTHWKSGPIFSAGARLRTSDGFAVDGVVEYSTHHWDNSWLPPVNSPRNSILELSGIGRSSFRTIGPCHFCFLYGLGLSYQQKDELIREYNGTQYVTPKNHDLTASLILGVGLEVRVPAGLEISLEGNIRGRRYATPVAEFAIAYHI